MASLLTVAAALMLPAANLVAAAPAPPGLIVGGTAASSGEFPYIVSLQQGGSHFCGGVLINAYTVLTAAHCSVDTAASSVKVRAGSLDYTTGGKYVGVQKIVVNPNYNDQTVDNDIALWHLSTAIQQSSTIGYATLPSQGSDPSPGSSVTVAGWGLTSESGSTLPTKLRKVSVPVVSRSQCSADYDGGITSNMFCAAEANGGKDSCSGDSGGPIVDTNTGVLAGTVSFGQGCAEKGYPGVYSRIGNYVNYINSNKWTS